MEPADVSQAVAEVVRRTIVSNELGQTRYGRVVLYEVLQNVINDLRLEGLDTRDLARVLTKLREQRIG